MRMSNNEIAENSFSIKRRRLITDSSSSEDDDDPMDASRKKSRICIQETDSECDSDNSTKICTRNVARINSDSSSSSDSEVVRKVKGHPVLESENGDESSEWESANNESDAEEQTALQNTNENAADGFSSDSSNGESEKCPICLMSFKNQEVGSPEACDHSFCVDCIQEWSKSVNTCPVDRKKFDLILVRTNYNGIYVRSITVQEPFENALETNYDASFCEVCGLSNHEDRLLLCDQCDAAYHLECLQPPLAEVPLEEWFCPVCSLNRLNLQLLDNFLHELDNVGLNWNETQRLVPRTRQTERIRNRIINQRATNENNNREDPRQYLEEMNRPGPSTSSRRTTTCKKATTRKRKYVKRKSTKRCKKSKQKSRYRTIYEIDDATGEKIALKKIIRKYKKKKKKLKKRKVRRIVIPKSVKNRLAKQLGICPPTRTGQTLPDVKIQINTANIGQRRNQAGIPALHLFGRRDELDYFSASELEIEGPGVNILVARRPNISDTAVLQRASRNKTINLPTSTSASSVDLLGSILDTQTKFHSRKSIISVKSDGSIKIDIDNNPLQPSNQNIHVRQTPMSPNTNTTTKTSSSNGRGTSTVDTSNSNRYSEPINYSLYENTVPTSTVGSSNNGQHNCENNGPQDYSMNRIHCNTNEPDDSKEKKKNSRTGNLEENSTINSDSELDIYSDIETVSTSKVEDSEIQYHSPAPGTSTENIASIEDDNESDTDLVIDTEKPSDDKYDPAAAFESDNDEDTKDECVTSTSGTLVDTQHSNFTPTKWNAEIQSETVQSSNQTEFQQQFNTIQKTTEDNEDAEDDCPNFSIYSSESLHMAKHADILMEVNKIESNVTSGNIGNTQTTTTQKTDKSSTSKTKVSSGLYSDSEDETIIKINHQKPFGIGDIQNMTEDISEEERSYTPCLDEREPNSKEGLDGLDTEMISDDDKNDFEETQEVKTVSDGDALEINAKESELDFTRPEDCEEGEIIDKSKLKDQEDIPEEKNDTNIDNGNENNDNNYKESDVDEEPVFKKLSKNNKERNYRDKERSKSREKKNKANKDSKSKDKRREKRKEIERYDVRTLVDAKPKRDRFGRDLIKRKSRSTSKSHTPPRRLGREDEFRRSKSHSSRSTPPRRFGRDIRKSPSFSSSRSCTPPRRSLSRSKRSRDFRRRQRSESRSRSRDRRVSRSRIRRQHSSSRARNKSTKKDNKAKHNREKIRSRSQSKTRTNWRRRQSRAWTPSLSRSASPLRLQSPSWTPPHILNPCVRPQNLTVILPNDASKKKKDKKKRTDRKTKDNTDKQRKRRRNERSPPPSKEVFTSGNNILVSVSFNKANETTEERTKRKHDAIQELTTKRMRKEKEREKTKVLKRKRIQNISNIKPVAIIDLDRSPFKELTPSPKDVIVLSDSENADSNDLLEIQKTIRRETSQQVTSPEVSVNNNYINSMGPKTPPEPQVKFTFNQKQPQLRQISNPLHEPDDVDEEIDPQEELENRLNEVMHKGPNTPPEPPNSPPSSPDAYDPFDPTKSRTPTPEPKQSNMQSSVSQVVEDTQEELVEHPVIEVLDKCDSPPGSMPVSKSHTPPIPIADIQPADSQSSIRVITPDTNIDNSPERPIGVIINQIVQSQSNVVSKPTTSAIYSSVSTSLITSTPIASNQSVSRVNILNSAIITPPIITSTISQRILPNTNNARSSPINKISPPKTSVKLTSIKPMPSKGITKLPSTTKWKGKARNNNENDANLDFDSPYSPGSSDYEDLFEPPPETVKASAPKPTKSGKSSPKPQNTFDNLFGSSPMYINKSKNKTTKAKVKRTHHTTKGTKQVGVKLDENNLKILDELPNSAVEMQVKDKFLKKLNRQERVVEEVKFVLKPYYNKKRVTKEEYKDILRKAVPKICHNKSGEINPKKIQHLVEAYVKKIRHNKKVTSSSSVNPQKTEVVSNWLSKLN